MFGLFDNYSFNLIWNYPINLSIYHFDSLIININVVQSSWTIQAYILADHCNTNK